MKVLYTPTIEESQKALRRPSQQTEQQIEDTANILRQVREKGDQAIQFFNAKYDNSRQADFKIEKSQILQAAKQLDEPLKQAILKAYANIKKFHASQLSPNKKIITSAGIVCWQENKPIENVGLYIPGGTAPLFSTILMLGIPARLANCQRIVVCHPIKGNASMHPAVAFCLDLLNITEVYNIGGAQAIAAMGYGTSSIKRVDKIFGPGNAYVTHAKQILQQNGVAIDMPAGPSEVLVIADESANPTFVASDLIAQAEHGPDSQVVLLTTSRAILKQTLAALKEQLEKLPRKEIAEKALKNSVAILVKDLPTAFSWSNFYAPEHLILAIDEAGQYTGKISNAGSVFLGHYSCESMGDYASGTNHTLPTYGFARSYSGVSTLSFCKQVTFQEITKKGIENLGDAVALMAEAEGLAGHKNAVDLRINNLKL